MEYSENTTEIDFVTSSTTEAIPLIPDQNAPEDTYATASLVTLIICSLGLIGNLLSLSVLLSRQMRCFGHVFLLLGLTVCDIIVLLLGFLNASENMNLHHLLNGEYDKLGRTVLAWIGSAGTRYFTVAISIERFLVIFYPLKAPSWITVPRERIAALSIFAFLVILGCFSTFIKETIPWKDYNIYSATVQNFIPFTLVVAFNTATVLKIWRYTRVRNELRGVHDNPKKVKDQSANNQSNSVTRMLLTVVFVFIFCLSFETVRRLCHFIWPEYYQGLWLDFRINLLSDIFYVLNSTVNFIIYCLLGRKFRTTFLQLYLPCWFKKQESKNSSGATSFSHTQTSKI